MLKLTVRFGQRKDRVMRGHRSLAAMADDRQAGEDLDPYQLRLVPVYGWHGEDLWERSALPVDRVPVGGYRVLDHESGDLLGLLVQVPPSTRYAGQWRLRPGDAYIHRLAIETFSDRAEWVAVTTEAFALAARCEMEESVAQLLKHAGRPHRALARYGVPV